MAGCGGLYSGDQCVKALYRRAVANERLKEYTNGLADVKKALKTVPDDVDFLKADVKKALKTVPDDVDFLKLKERLEVKIKAEKEQQKKMYSRMFG
ncbi:DnaK family domain containing protein, putative [Eimeria mitis]|uniref:DnaK family domain containing protein, putative n=1 Tax=Eimeria mitis TaxID=44415 RepID=U6JU71_9EIME|nr:DnaK family domain containing protein, putative [Eimeria mitis]CDJ29005.1 DnaK family domain containing protein, putative [Eimeria mitis]